MRGNWNVLTETWKLLEEMYDILFELCLSFKNFHVGLRQICEGDGATFRYVKNRFVAIMD